MDKKGKKYLKIDMQFTKSEYEYLCEECMFNNLQRQIFKDRIEGKSIIQISLEQNLSKETIDKNIKKIKNKIIRVI